MKEDRYTDNQSLAIAWKKTTHSRMVPMLQSVNPNLLSFRLDVYIGMQVLSVQFNTFALYHILVIKSNKLGLNEAVSSCWVDVLGRKEIATDNQLSAFSHQLSV